MFSLILLVNNFCFHLIFYMQMASNRRLWWTDEKCFLNLYTVYVFVTSTMVKCPKDSRIINVNVHLVNAQKKSDILWNNGARFNGQEKTFYSPVNIARVYFAKHITKGSTYRERYKHAIAMCNIEQRFSDHDICIALTESSPDIKVCWFNRANDKFIIAILMMRVSIYNSFSSCNDKLLKSYFTLNHLFNSAFISPYSRSKQLFNYPTLSRFYWIF